MKNLKKMLAVATCVAVLATQTMPAMAKDRKKDITVEIDGKKIEFDVNPQMDNDRTMVPMRKMFEELGALVKWDGETNTVIARKNKKTVKITIDSEKMEIDKGKTDEEGNPIVETVTLDVPAKLVSDRTLVPTRAVSEAFGLEVDWNDEEQKVIVTSDEEDDSWKENTGTLDLSKMTFSGDGIEIDEKQITVTKGGDYTLTGILENGNIIVDTKERVKIRLSNASITSSEGPCIFVKDADKAYITLEDGTENTLTALNSEDGVIYSKENLEFKGDGKVNITGKAGHGIKASDNLTIEKGVLDINATGDGIHVNDTFKMEGGEVSIVAVGDGIDSESIVIISGGKLDIETNGKPIEAEKTAETKTETAKNEATDEATDETKAETVSGEKTNETTVETKSENDGSETVTNGKNGMPRWGMGGMWMEEVSVEFEKSSKGINAEWMMSISGGEITVDATSHAIHCQDEIEISGGASTLSSEYEKGISAHGNLTIGGAETVIEITKSTEGIESKNVATINDGTIRITASDDGINATGGQSMSQPPMPGGGGMPMQNGERPAMPEGGWQNGMFGGGRWNGGMPQGGQLIPENGEVPENGQQPMPGGGRWNGGMPQEGQIMPEGGRSPMPGDGKWNGRVPWDAQTMPGNVQSDVDITQKGQRPEGGNRGGFGGMGRNGKLCLIINGGDIEINAGDDCLDANGNMELNGGIVKAVKESGTFTGNMGIIDADGQITVGENASVIAAGRGGTQGGFTVNGNTVTVYCETAKNAGDRISVSDEAGNVILEYAPDSKFSAVMLVSPKIEMGKTYAVSIGDEVHQVSISEKSTVVGTAQNGGFGGNRRPW